MVVHGISFGVMQPCIVISEMCKNHKYWRKKNVLYENNIIILKFLLNRRNIFLWVYIFVDCANLLYYDYVVTGKIYLWVLPKLHFCTIKPPPRTFIPFQPVAHTFISREGSVLFNDALNVLYLSLYGVGYMVKDYSDSESGKMLPPHGLLFSISSKGFYMHHPTDRITHTTAFVTPVVEHWLEREIAQWVHHEGPIPTTHRTMSECSYHRATSRSPFYIKGSGMCFPVCEKGAFKRFFILAPLKICIINGE